MRPIAILPLLAAVLMQVPASPAVVSAQEPQHGEIEVLVTVGLEPLAGASVSLDLNGDGVWQEHLGEPIRWTGGDGVALFADVVAIEDPGDGGQADPGDWQPARIMMGNLRGAVGAREVQVDFVLPAGTGAARLGLYDVRGRRIAEDRGAGDLTLDLPAGLPSGVYVLRLGADHAAPASQRITSAGARTRTVRAHRVSAAEAVAAGWADGRPAGPRKSRRSQDPPHGINLIVAHDDHATVVRPEVIEPGPNRFTVDLLSGLDGFVHILPGMFMMGSPPDEPGRFDAEGPQHPVTLTTGFHMARYEVTEAWWSRVMGGSPTSSTLPKSHVSWDLAVQFCNALSVQEGLTPAYTIHGPGGDVIWDRQADGYRLPTEAEWEYACRAGGATAFAGGPITHIVCEPPDPQLDALGWYCGNRTTADGLAPVGQKQPNAWGLHDMHGGVLEWTWCAMRAYSADPQTDPATDGAPGAERMIRGGSWRHNAHHCRSAARLLHDPDLEFFVFGLRPVRSAF